MATAMNTRCMATGARHELRMVLLGKTGSGKSSLGNTILNGKRFTVGFSPQSITTQCACASRELNGKRLFVVDTPGFIDTNVTREDIQTEVAKSYQMTALPGPHAFLLALEPRKWTPEELEAVDYLGKIFGPQAINHTIIIFTHGDEFITNETTIDEYLGLLNENSSLKQLVEQCGNRYLLVNNRGEDTEKEETVRKLLNMIARMIETNGVYRSTEFDRVAEVIHMETSKGTYNPFKPDGSFVLLPKTKEIVIEGFLRRTVGRKVAY